MFQFLGFTGWLSDYLSSQVGETWLPCHDHTMIMAKHGYDHAMIMAKHGYDHAMIMAKHGYDHAMMTAMFLGMVVMIHGMIMV